MLRHAPQRTHLSASQAASSASNFVRPVVHQHDVHLFGTVDLVVLPRSLNERDEVSDRLPGRGTRRELEKAGHVLETRHQLFDAHERDVHAGQRRCKSDVSLVLDERDRTGVRRQEVAARDPEICLEELGPKRDPSCPRELVRFCVEWRAQPFVEQPSAVVNAKVNRGSHDVAWRIPQQLDDVLAEVRLTHVHSEPFEVLVHAQLLAEHALGLHGALNAVLADDLAEYRERLGRSLRPVYTGSVRGEPFFGPLQILIQIP